MKPYKQFHEEAMSTGDAGFGTGPVIDTDDIRVPSGDIPLNRRKKVSENEGPEEDAVELITLSGDDVADKQAKSQPLQAPDGADSSGA